MVVAKNKAVNNWLRCNIFTNVMTAFAILRQIVLFEMSLVQFGYSQILKFKKLRCLAASCTVALPGFMFNRLNSSFK